MSEMPNHRHIEEKWNKTWQQLKLGKYKGNKTSKFYLLEMFAYPSGDLHIGHLRNYVLGDVLHRYKLMNGFDVIHPVGWDSFGLPAEEAAIKRNIAPDKWTMNNISISGNTLKRMGFLYDWDREVITSSPDYYKWTQWIFIELFKKGLVYRKKAFVNWCPNCNTVLANEQVEQGNCWRCKATVKKIQKVQWFIKITEYAEQLLNDLDRLTGWPENVKIMQKNWIGRSEGLKVTFKVEDSNRNIDIFTTRPDTLFGVTFIAIAPESDILQELNIKSENIETVKKYIEKSLLKTEIERTAQREDKDGVFTGLYAINPMNNEKVEIWVADYVLASYGTGAVMSVPAHDERDHTFAKKYKLNIKPVIMPLTGEWDFNKAAFIDGGILIDSGEFIGLKSNEAIKSINDFIEKHGIGEKTINFKIRDWLVSRQRYWGAPIPMIHCQKCGVIPSPESDLPVLLPDSKDVDFIPKGDSPLASNNEFINTICPKCGSEAKRDPDTMDTFVDSSWYQLRYVDAKNDNEIFSRKNADDQLPIDMYIGGIEHANGHLIYFRFMTKFLRDIGLHGESEPALHLINQGMIMDSKGQIMSKSKGNAVPVGPFVEKYGTDIARGTMLFIGPGYKDALWSEDGIVGVSRFIDRLVRICLKYSDKNAVNTLPINETEKKLFVKLNKSIKSINNDIERFEHNTAIAAIMELVNMIYIEEEKLSPEFISSVLFNILKLTSVFIPHTSEELFSIYNCTESILLEKWPKYDKKWLIDDEIIVIVQVNGKVRAKISVQPGLDEETIFRIATEDDNIKRYLESGKLVKRIYVKNKLLSLVVK